ncbi:uncharacterized protein TM35_001541010 [Trypanosoma theileri]|uniref:Uncharacterized protein n=1 Tax=Trypanosoma theileri TaxID=67003 RepID=A0A1X0NET0_9TRYP|nr:uncharacterized protein TM35_001541010 [Trypanosoma theileri]ORC80608.1 hypothetical protein TM35_001541010 [Trypanosoma theileri]
MTTMMFKLRRVVYLLVLVQCFVCVAYAESANGVEQGPSPIELTEAEKVNQLSKTVAEVYEHIVHMYGCLFVLEDNTKVCKGNSDRVELATSNIKGLVKEIEKLKEERGVLEPEEWMKGRKDGIQKNVNAIGSLRISLIDMRILQHSCENQTWDVNEDMEKLVDAGNKFLGVHPNEAQETTEKGKLKKNISEAKQALLNLKERLNSAQDELNPLEKVDELMDDASKAVGTLMQSLGSLSKLISVPAGIMDNEGLEKIAVERNVTVTEKLKEAKAKAEKEFLPPVEEVPVKEEEKLPSVKPEEETESEDKGQPPKETEEPQDVEEKPQETHEKEENKENAGEQAEAKPEQEERIEEESKKPDKEEERTQTATNGNDNSNSPALVHSPLLLLLLLCVLGCTLVC